MKSTIGFLDWMLSQLVSSSVVVIHFRGLLLRPDILQRIHLLSFVSQSLIVFGNQKIFAATGTLLMAGWPVWKMVTAVFPKRLGFNFVSSWNTTATRGNMFL